MAEVPTTPTATDRQQAAILAGLNLLFHRQRGEGLPDETAFEEVLTNGDAFEALDIEGIDLLIETINTDGLLIDRESVS